MRVILTKEGLLIPRRLLKGVAEVEVRRMQGRVVVLPVPGVGDPILDLGSKPVRTGVRNGSERHDDYLYDRG